MDFVFLPGNKVFITLAYSRLLQVCKFYGDNVLGHATILFESLNLTGQKPIEHGRLEAEFHI